MRAQQRVERRWDRRRRPAEGIRRTLDEVIHEQRQIVETRAQRRNAK
jgi:hypothetical protein